ncbi:MAG: type pilus assembly protein PilA [Solirubrobacterales bacterium]|jgi:type IV pilus assembly protein PilA|nr:type pilus assembly protein PilA [Solirubrobacterales bacterium]
MRARFADDQGFTLVELLVVMLILGLLAAIALPLFFNQRTKAQDAEARSAVRTAQTAIETYATDHDGSYEGAEADDLRAIEETLVDAAISDVTSDENSYSITVESSAGDPLHTFTIARKSDGRTEYSCTEHGEGGCPITGRWADA